MLLQIGLLLLGFVLLIKGADFFVDGSSNIARRLKVSSLIIGLTLVAMGTSLPELSVSVVASVNGNNALSISNAIGSNIFNLLVVLGATAAFNEIFVEKDLLKRDIPVSIFCGAIIVVSGLIFKSLTRPIGIILLLCFVAYLFKVVKDAKTESVEEEETIVTKPLFLCVVFVIGGIAAIKIGGDLVVNSATAIAKRFGISETLIGLTIVSVGTSLPELVTSMVAAKKGEVEMAIGNAVGSNIFNILLILGVASAISPISFLTENIIDAGVFLAISVLGLAFCKTQSKLSKKEGFVLLACYAAYLCYILNR